MDPASNQCVINSISDKKRKKKKKERGRRKEENSCEIEPFSLRLVVIS